MNNQNPKWSKIIDFRDDAILTPNGRARYELLIDDNYGDVEEHELPALPKGADHAWQYGGRWLCE
jgi:hypothetical protein